MEVWHASAGRATLTGNLNERFAMLPKYSIEYTVSFKKHDFMHHVGTDDPVAAEEFLEELLERGYRIRGIKHEGAQLSQKDGDRMLRTAAGMLASKRLCASLGIKPEEERFRFGFTA
ncbi:MAG TPA: hypothetical protein DCY13_01710 [Verrucomicrobiales bacterium]|nr:hypothetical protein [Verrucomicrobiales bacterium]